uniref:Thioredoxin domain-containing protein n=1 Tax=Panagrellus redivivus TaxID=6233 RepID=A0A7E4ULX0_PANRE
MLRVQLLIVSVAVVCAQCPFKHGGGDHVGHHHPPAVKQIFAETNDDSGPPGSEPDPHFIQTTFIHRDKSDEDLKFTQEVIELINILRMKLKSHAKLAIDNENIDCEGGGFPQCKEYPLNSAYHFLVVEDSSHGAAIYSLDRIHNTNVEKIELALLDALSRHSKISLMPFASENTEHELGFVRVITPKELARFARDNSAANKAPPTTIYTRSPTELNLINENILEFRKIEEPTISTDDALADLKGSDLNDALEDPKTKYVFVLFWTRVSSVSLHALQLWKETAENFKSNEEVVIGAVACHDEQEVCRAFGIGHHDKHTIFAYQHGQKLTAQFNMRDSQFYTEWIKLVIAGPVQKVETLEKLAEARKGYIEAIKDLGKQAVVTVGIFQSEDSDEFIRFRKVALILFGRYHFVYFINPDAAASITTFRPFEKTRRIDYNGNFDVPSLVRHITQSSVPSIFNFSHGFTGDVIYYSAKSLVLLVHNEDADRRAEFVELASSNANAVLYAFAEIDRSSSVELKTFFKAINLETTAVPLLCVFAEKQIRCHKNVQKIDVSLLKSDIDAHFVDLETNEPHPLKYIQLEHINSIFGTQEIKLLPDPVLTKPINHHGGFNPHGAGVDMPSADASGCPMMSHLNNNLRDEL